MNSTQNKLALILVAVLGFACLFLIVFGAFDGQPNYITIGLTPVVSSGSAVLGYYFGKKQGDSTGPEKRLP